YRQPPGVADSAEGFLETHVSLRSGVAHTFGIGSHRWPALLSSVLHQPAVASVVRTERRGRRSLSFLCRLEHWLDVSISKLPHTDRAMGCHFASSGWMVVGIRCRRSCVCGGRTFFCPQRPYGWATRGHASTSLESANSVDQPGSMWLSASACHHPPHLSKHCFRSASLGDSSRFVPAYVHIMF